MVEAVSYGNVTLSATGSDTNVTFVGAVVDADDVEVDSTYITMWNASVTNYNATIMCDVLNFSSPSSTVDSVAFPQVTASSGNVLTIVNGLTGACVARVSITTSRTPSAPRFTLSNGSTLSPAYTFDADNQTMTIATVSIPVGISNLSLDTAGPVITLDAPITGSASTGGTVSFQYTPVDSDLISNCSLLYGGSGAVYATSSSIVNNASNSFVVTGVDQNHPLGGAPLSWSISCTDEYGNVGTSATNTVVTYTPTGGGSSGGGSGGGSGGSVGSGGGTVTNTTNTTMTNTTGKTKTGSSKQPKRMTGGAEELAATAELIDRRNLTLAVIGVLTLIIIGIGAVAFAKR